MKIMLNGVWREIDGGVASGDAAAVNRLGTTLETLLTSLGFGNAVVATALNGEFVPSDARALARVHDGDRLEVLAPMQGG